MLFYGILYNPINNPINLIHSFANDKYIMLVVSFSLNSSDSLKTVERLRCTIRWLNIIMLNVLGGKRSRLLTIGL